MMLKKYSVSTGKKNDAENNCDIVASMSENKSD